MKLIHSLILAFAALAAGLPAFETAFPPAAAPYMKAVQASLILVVAVLATLDAPTTSALARNTPAAPPPVKL